MVQIYGNIWRNRERIGVERDSTGLYYMRARYYNPEIKRFINQDILLGGIGDSTSLNRYAYVNGNPINSIDPFGLEAIRTVNGSVDWTFYDSIYATQGIAYIPEQLQSEYLGNTGEVPWYEDPFTYMGGLGGIYKGIAKGFLGSFTKYVLNEKGSLDLVKTIRLSKSKYPESTKHIEDAIKNGQPDILTVNRGGAKGNRKESLRGLKKQKGKDLDEYPPAMFKEGGTGASVRAINPSDNRGAGSTIGHSLRGVPDGTKVRIEIID